ncbi:MAG: ABC transporter ATP-binding protein [Gammaproteobacteria bacterium]|nr:ABC transporter ATP-binding protein [Gammaproteobacteria bacterium]MDH3505682.1 ABC transporter ATP-binding protein [Gammaproteobacteria bacterium]
MKLTAEQVTVRAQQRTILDNASVTLEPGELVGLIGPNGAGKSTLLRSIIGSLPYSTGRVDLDGTPIMALTARQRARALAYLPQDRHVEWPLPSRAVVALGRYPHASGVGPAQPSDSEAVDRAMAAVGAAALADRSATVLSGGELTRVLLARALAVEAPLLLADEPIAGLDPFHQLHVMEILRATAHGGAGVLAVLHDLPLAMRFMDRVVLMHEGAVVANGTPGEVLTDENLERVYRVTARRGSADGVAYVLPWSRVG